MLVVVSSPAGVFDGAADKKEQMTEGQIDPRCASVRGKEMASGHFRYPGAHRAPRPSSRQNGTQVHVQSTVFALQADVSASDPVPLSELVDPLASDLGWRALPPRPHQTTPRQSGCAAQAGQARVARDEAKARVQEPPACPGPIREQTASSARERASGHYRVSPLSDGQAPESQNTAA